MPAILSDATTFGFPLEIRARSDSRVRDEAFRLVSKYDARLNRAARRADGDDGAALVCAFADMVRDGDLPPETWPLPDVIALMRRADPSEDAQVRAIINRLEGLDDLIRESFKAERFRIPTDDPDFLSDAA